MSKVYISGQISGLEKDDYMERFAEAEKKLSKEFFSVINPAKVNAQLPDDTTYEQYMKMSLTMLEMCDYIYMLTGWENSSGACLEYQYAKTLGKEIIFQEREEKNSEKPQREIWANAVLKDGKLIFWCTDSEKKEMWDFYKDSPNGDLRMNEALKTGRCQLVNRKVETTEDAEEFYRQYEMYDPYTNSKTILPEVFYE